MSTSDSRINSSSVLFTHDIYGLLSKNKGKEIYVARLFACVLGFGTIVLSLAKKDLLNIIVFANSFYTPLVIPPFLLTIIGFRSSASSVICGMMAGLIVTVSWKFVPSEFTASSHNILGIFVAILGNLIFLFAFHYLLNQPGGWVGIKDKSYIEEKKQLISI